MFTNVVDIHCRKASQETEAHGHSKKIMPCLLFCLHACAYKISSPTLKFMAFTKQNCQVLYFTRGSQSVIRAVQCFFFFSSKNKFRFDMICFQCQTQCRLSWIKSHIITQICIHTYLVMYTYSVIIYFGKFCHFPKRDECSQIILSHRISTLSIMM